jgi:hypothetical protein
MLGRPKFSPWRLLLLLWLLCLLGDIASDFCHDCVCGGMCADSGEDSGEFELL